MIKDDLELMKELLKIEKILDKAIEQWHTYILNYCLNKGGLCEQVNNDNDVITMVVEILEDKMNGTRNFINAVISKLFNQHDPYGEIYKTLDIKSEITSVFRESYKGLVDAYNWNTSVKSNKDKFLERLLFFQAECFSMGYSIWEKLFNKYKETRIKDQYNAFEALNVIMNSLKEDVASIKTMDMLSLNRL